MTLNKQPFSVFLCAPLQPDVGLMALPCATARFNHWVFTFFTIRTPKVNMLPIYSSRNMEWEGNDRARVQQAESRWRIFSRRYKTLDMSCSGILARRKRESFFGGGTSGLNSLDTLRSFLFLLLLVLLLFLFQLLHLFPLLSSYSAELLHDIWEGRKCAGSRSKSFSVSSAAAQTSCLRLSNRNHSSLRKF